MDIALIEGTSGIMNLSDYANEVDRMRQRLKTSLAKLKERHEEVTYEIEEKWSDLVQLIDDHNELVAEADKLREAICLNLQKLDPEKRYAMLLDAWETELDTISGYEENLDLDVEFPKNDDYFPRGEYRLVSFIVYEDQVRGMEKSALLELLLRGLERAGVPPQVASARVVKLLGRSRKEVVKALEEVFEIVDESV